MPAVTVVKRGRSWSLRFRVPKHVAERHLLPLQCRMSTALPESAPESRVESERRRCRSKQYGVEVVKALKEAWEASDRMCSPPSRAVC